MLLLSSVLMLVRSSNSKPVITFKNITISIIQYKSSFLGSLTRDGTTSKYLCLWKRVEYKIKLSFTQHLLSPDTLHYKIPMTTSKPFLSPSGALKPRWRVILQVYLRYCIFIPDHCNKSNIAIKLVPGIFWFPSAYRSCVYSILQPIKCATTLCLKKPTYIHQLKNTLLQK